MKKILVVEDRPNHMKDALEFLSSIEGLEIFTATNASEASGIIFNEDLDGVITDIFIPISSGKSSENPCGLIVAAQAKEKGIRCVLCTDQYHHGEKLEWLYQMFCALRKPLNCGWGETIIDRGHNPHSSKKKNWKAAYEDICGLYDRR